MVVTHWHFLCGCVSFFVYAMSNFVKCILKFYFYIYNLEFWHLHGYVHQEIMHQQIKVCQ